MMKIGFIGIGKMGNRMVSKLANGGHEVVVWNRTRAKAEELKGHIASLQIADSVKDLVNKLEKPRIIWSVYSTCFFRLINGSIRKIILPQSKQNHD